ncbi:DUF397 domain-containing protein [Haloechinothrix sp. LS1_15]|uniref:DUF397 domain-containing protein n=1 Tax=Haloechinothrix sp. LS1_15 TaxID=2652248 RepID=UPI002947C0DC|nr:DUF397 domain-containing protein [Haloechinothrix sp. LS1_15]MDV6011200.1 DUF397 domain-containing protein [Haloechinothrix sp. LS1_15]
MPEPKDLRWRKSSFSEGAQTCVEVAFAADGGRWLRDTKDRHGGAHHITAEQWDALLAGMRHGRLA